MQFESGLATLSVRKVRETLAHPPAVIALTEADYALFFPGAARARLEALLPGRQRWEAGLTGEAWPEWLRSEQIGIVVSGWSTPRLPERTDALRSVCHVGGSVRDVVPRSLLEQGVVVTNWGSLASRSVAEAALHLTLCALRRTPHYLDLMAGNGGGWSARPHGTRSLYGRRVGIHGLGAVARSLIPLLQPFGCRISACSEGAPARICDELGVRRAASLDELFSGSEILIEAEGLTPASRGSVDERRLRLLPAGAVFVNVARGGLVADEAALARVAAERGLRLALDVYAQEPLPAESPLRRLPEAFLQPHIAGPTDDEAARCGKRLCDNLVRVLAGETPPDIVSLAAYDRST
ncbi:phosphoglycerate dehydrogenase [Opitutaceae bacterium TAV5]|nr:phosphoglycerate dehydrogenase [Opitutaceae bacterium TAV5]